MTPRHREDKELDLFTLTLQCTNNFSLLGRKELKSSLIPLGKLCGLAQGQPPEKGSFFFFKVPSYVPVGDESVRGLGLFLMCMKELYSSV